MSFSKSEMEGREIICPLHGQTTQNVMFNLVTQMFIKPCCSKK